MINKLPHFETSAVLVKPLFNPSATLAAATTLLPS
jgi:hypothetical protein